MTLDQKLQSGKRISIPLSLSILQQCARELDAAHASGLVHRNLTPAHIVVSEPDLDGQVLAQLAEYGADRAQPEEFALGLPPPEFAAYMSPEEILGTTPDQRSDEFCLAIIAYELLCGRKPFQPASLSTLFFEICANAPRPAEELNPELGPAAGSVLLRALAKDPDQRFQSCSDFVQQLEESLPQVAGPLPLMEPQEERIAPSAPRAPITPFPAAPAFKLPPARKRAYGGEEYADSEPRKSRSSVQTFGLVALGLIVAIGLGAWLLNWRPKPNMPVQVLDSRAEPASPPPTQDQASGQPPTKPLTPPQSPAKPLQHAPTPAPPVQRPRAPSSRPPQAQSRAGKGAADVDLLTVPPRARVIVDNRPETSCSSPCSLVLAPGRHVLKANLDGFVTAQRIFHVPKDSSVVISLIRNLGTLLVTSRPVGASVMLDGKDMGRTPLTLHLKPGRHRLDAFLGSQVQQKIIDVQADAIQGASFNLNAR
jgi:serine/threonine protein kinase